MLAGYPDPVITHRQRHFMSRLHRAGYSASVPVILLIGTLMTALAAAQPATGDQTPQGEKGLILSPPVEPRQPPQTPVPESEPAAEPKPRPAPTRDDEKPEATSARTAAKDELAEAKEIPTATGSDREDGNPARARLGDAEREPDLAGGDAEKEEDLAESKGGKEGKGPDFRLAARLMTGWELQSERPEPTEAAEESTEQQLFLRQARLKVIARMTEKLVVNLSAELADAVRSKTVGGVDDEMPYLRNAYMNIRIKRAIQIRAGRFKRPFSRLENRSTGSIPFRGRGLSNDLIVKSAGWGDRSIGLMLWGRVREANLTWRAAVSNPDWNSDNDLEDPGVDVIGRLVYSPCDALSIGISGGHKLRERVGSNERLNTDAVGGDIRFRFGGLYTSLEAMVAQLPDEEGVPFAYGILGYANYHLVLSDDWTLQPTVFGEYADANAEYRQSEAIRAVFGVNLLWKEGLRIMPQVELVRPRGDHNPWWNAKETYYLMLSADT